jgi:hypothetical protein
LDVGIDGIFGEIKEGLEAGITIAFGGLFGSVSELVRKERISSGEIESNSLSTNSVWNWEKINS